MKTLLTALLLAACGSGCRLFRDEHSSSSSFRYDPVVTTTHPEQWR